MQPATRVSIGPNPYYRGAAARPQPAARRGQLSRTLSAPLINKWQLLPTFINQALDAARLTAVFEISQSLMRAQGTTVGTSGDALSAVLKTTYDGFNRLFPNARVAIELRAGILDRKSNADRFPILAQNGSSGLVSQITRDPASVEDVSRSTMGLPLLDGKQNLLGVVVISLGRERNSSDAIAAEHLRQTASMIIEGTVEREQLLHESTTDALTGLKNRGYFDERIERDINMARRHGQPMSLLMLDIDHFKRINDDIGHQAGDKVLRDLSDLLGQIPRPEDASCRYGGEEFAVILPNTNAQGASKLADRIVQLVRKHKFTTKDGEHVPVTVSIGVSTLSDGQNSHDLVGEADGNLYQAKNGGRNRVVPEPE